MFIHYKTSEDHAFEYLGLSLEAKPDVINITTEREQYVEWMMNPGLFRKFVPVQRDGTWILETLSDKRVLNDMELIPEPKDADPREYDVLMVLTEGTILVHVFNEHMVSSNAEILFYATEADDHTVPVFELTATGVDTVETDIEYDPKNIRILVRGPLEGVEYGLKISE